MRNCKARIMGTITAVLVFLSVGVAHAQRRYVETRVVSTGTATGLSAFANQLAPDSVTGMCLQADVSNRTVWGPCGSLPTGTPGQVAGIKTVTVSTTTTGTSTATASATAYQAVNGTLYAGSNVTLSKGTSTATSTAVDLADSPRIHAASSSYSFSTVTPAAVGTSGSVGTSTLLQRADHVHQGDGNDKVRIYSGYTPGYLYDIVFSSTGSINVGLSSQKLNLGANFGTGANTVCEGNDSRLSNARTPKAHASTHVTGGSDPIAEATTSVAGLLSASDKEKLDSTTTVPAAYSIPATGSTQYLTAWIQAASASNAGLLSASHYARINGARDTAGISGVLPLTGSYGYLHQFAPIYANTTCASGSSDVTVTSSGITTLATITVKTSDLTSSGSNRLKLTYHLSGYAIGGAAAIARAWVLVHNWLGQDKVPCTATVATAANRYAIVMTASCEVWDANWLTYTTSFYLQIDTSSGTLFIPLNTQAGFYSACLTIDGLHSL